MSMRISRTTTARLLCFLLIAAGFSGCAQKNPADIQVTRLAEFSDRLNQAHVKILQYSGEVKKENIKAYTEEKLGCNMLYAFFYPDTVPVNEIPLYEINTAKSFAEVQKILFQGEGVARWRFAAQCFSIIPVVADCYKNPVSQNCR